MLSILNYHSIDDLGLITSVCPARFAEQIRFLVEHDYRILPLEDALALLKSDAPIPQRCATITFDDGYQSVYTHAFAYLRRFSLAATIFVTTGGIGKWSAPARLDLPHTQRPMLSVNEIRELAANGFTIGAHTVTHPHLTRLPLEEARREIEESQIQLEQITGRPVRHFAYPHGDHSVGILDVVRGRFDSAYGVSFRHATHNDDPSNLPRLDTFYLDHLLRLGGPDEARALLYARFHRIVRALRLRVMRADDSPY